MNAFEKILLGFLQAAPAFTPIFVHSSQGYAIVNASEALFASILAQFAPQPAPVAAPAAVPAAAPKAA